MSAGAALAAQRCHNHPQREAAALCTSCRRSFCRECVGDHHGRMLCAGCLARELGAAPSPARAAGRTRARLGRVAAAAAGLLVAWIVFAALGRILHALPAETHELATEGGAQ